MSLCCPPRFASGPLVGPHGLRGQLSGALPYLSRRRETPTERKTGQRKIRETPPGPTFSRSAAPPAGRWRDANAGHSRTIPGTIVERSWNGHCAGAVFSRSRKCPRRQAGYRRRDRARRCARLMRNRCDRIGPRLKSRWNFESNGQRDERKTRTGFTTDRL
jgi:hypothetical protein